MEINNTTEREEQAQLIIDTAIQRARELGYGVVGDGTVHGNGIWIDRLRVRLAKQGQNQSA